ncbi:MAG: hypothetical protein ABUT39_16600 [Acidobacteriota bacterium]
MRSARLRAVAVATLLAFLAAGSRPAAADDIPRAIKRGSGAVRIFFWAYDYAQRLKGVYSSYNTCLARGFGGELCNSVATYCAFNRIPLGTVAGSFYDLFSLDQVFSTDCGDGICYACCYMPGGSGCHSAFHSEQGKPVINCNPLYGGGTKEVGDTLVTDPDSVPGQACLFTPQTCDHIPLCNRNRPPEQIAGINGDPQNIMKSPEALSSRARSFGTGAMATWDDYLSGYHTSADTPSDSIRQSVHPFSALGDFITGRGCTGWRNRLPASFPTDWSEEQFRLEDANGVYAEEASHYNGLRQLGVVRLMASVPNLFNRWSYVESRIWTPTAVNEYLAQIPDPDEALLRTMSPLALELLRRNNFLQDYRLLAVPLPGETVSPRFYNGCELGDPPVVQLGYQKRGSFGIDLRIEAADSAVSSARSVGMVVLWGDGSVTELTAPAGGAPQIVSHDYKTGGKYQVLAMAENEAGLRTVGAVVAATQGTGTSSAPAPTPVLSEVQLVDLQARIDSFSGNTLSMLFELGASPAAGEELALGISRALPVPLNTTVSFGTVAGWNMSATPLPSVTIRPSRFGDGYLVGFQENYFTLDRLRVGVYATEDNYLRFRDVPVTASMLRLYPAGSTQPVLLTQPTYTPEGRLKIPVQSGGVRYSRVDLLLPQSVYAQALLGPVTTAGWTGFNGSDAEIKPDDVQPAPPPALDFHTLTPCRLVDTRGASGPTGAPALQPGLSRELLLTGTACGVPATAKALALNVTVIAPTASGNLRLYPGRSPLTKTSTLNFAAGVTQANNTIPALAGDGSGTLNVYLGSSATAHLVVDVTGYFQ